jgi:hypothetical protein
VRGSVGGLCQSGRVQPVDDNGAVLNAEFSVVRDGLHLGLVLESAGGRGGVGGHSRNTSTFRR